MDWFAALVSRPIPPYDDEPRAFLVALTANHSHPFTGGPRNSLNYPSIFERCYPPVTVISQVNFNLSPVAQTNAGGVTGADRNLPAIKLPVIPPIQRFKMARHLHPYRPAARSRWRLFVVAPNQLDVKCVRMMFGWRCSVQNKGNKQCTKNNASHKAQRVELYK
jgi:hypothetical protein